MEKILSTGEVAEKKGVSPQAVLAAINRGDLKATRAGRFYVVTEEDCETWQPTKTQSERIQRRWEKKREA